MRKPELESHAVARAAKADLEMLVRGHNTCWSYRVCFFLAQLARATGREFLPPSYCTPLLAGQPQNLPAGAAEHLWSLSFNADSVIDALRSFWHDRLVSLCTGCPRHCPHLPVFHVYVQWMGLRDSDQKWLSYTNKVMPREHAIALMRFRLVAWHFLEVNRGRMVVRGRVARNQRACSVCPGCVEDEWHVIFQCTRYTHIRSQFSSLFPPSPPSDGDCGAMRDLVTNSDQAQLAHMLWLMSAARLSR